MLDEVALVGCSVLAVFMAWYAWMQCRLHSSSKKTKVYPTGIKVEHGIPLEEPLHAVIVAERV